MKEEVERLWVKELSSLNESQRRRFAALKAMELGWGGVSKVCKMTGMAHNTIDKGIKEIKEGKSIKTTGRLRKEGGGRKKIIAKNPQIKERIKEIMEETTAGDPMSLLKWTTQSTYGIAKEISKEIKISEDTVGRILKSEKYTLQANKKSKEGNQHPDRNAQFEHINNCGKEYIRKGEPMISIDTKKKELIGNFKNNGREWCLTRKPKLVNMHDFKDKNTPKAAPFGIFDVGKNEGYVNVGIDHDTAQFAVESIRQWWLNLGKKSYPHAKSIFITADCGGSNSARSRLWKKEIQTFANETGLEVKVSHFPPGTSKWNKIEHQLFSFISMNWKAKPLLDYQTIINLISATKTNKGLKVYARMDEGKYETGIKVSNEEFAKIRIVPDTFHGEWNYSILPCTI